MDVALIGIDTNILVRLLTRDDETQFALSRSLVERARTDGPILLNPIVLTEVVWVLERIYRILPQTARAKVAELAASREFKVPDVLPTGRWEAWFEEGHQDFFDIVIAASNGAAGCEATFTFDKTAARSVPGMELLS